MSNSYRRTIPITEQNEALIDDPESACSERKEEHSARDPKDAKIEKLELELAFVRERDSLYRDLKEHQEKVDSEIKRNVRNFGFGTIGFVIITLFSIFAASFGIYQFTSSLALSRLDVEFSDPNIQKLIQQAAETRVADIIDKQVNPVVDKANQTIGGLEEQLRQDVAAIRAEYRQELEDLKREVSQASDALTKLSSLAEFYDIATNVRSDDRGAFDKLLKIAANTSDTRNQQAKAFLANLPKEIDVLNLLVYPVDWKSTQIDPVHASIADFKSLMAHLPPIYQTTVMETVWNADHLPKSARIEFLLDILGACRENLGARDRQNVHKQLYSHV